VPRQIDEDHPIVVGDGRQLQAPVVSTGAEAVEKQQRRRIGVVPATALVVDVRPPRLSVVMSTLPHE
jgi:hypothetical protein